jgi:hypothetical protein
MGEGSGRERRGLQQRRKERRRSLPAPAPKTKLTDSEEARRLLRQARGREGVKHEIDTIELACTMSQVDRGVGEVWCEEEADRVGAGRREWGAGAGERRSAERLARSALLSPSRAEQQRALRRGICAELGAEMVRV